MVAGKGLRPGDILTAASGKTIEVNNTDAEGRLTLADALWYAQEKAGATAIVDVATLTGACIIALGDDIAGLFTPSDKMGAAMTAASKEAGGWPGWGCRQHDWRVLRAVCCGMRSLLARSASYRRSVPGTRL